METITKFQLNTMHAKPRPFNILLIEDNPGDIRLTQEAFKEGSTKVNLEVVTDGVEALRYLRKESNYMDKQSPDLILLDLNLPKKDGREILEEIKNDQSLRKIPIVVLTTSNAGKDILNSYDLHANCYIKKPHDFDKFFDIIHKIEEFWLSTTILPTMVG
ncbi:MAG TPA: response regulator [Saprospiraceae bacterium]|nr:response regulator [Saprospiraceae bacterium]HMQ83626.1 response regulator [Saprospiraceae bacterium]